MTMLKLLDFISVMLYTKRDDLFDIDSPVLFTNNMILEFMDIHKKFLIADEVVRICILSRRFRLAINVLNKYEIRFSIEFFKQALLSNAFDTAFFMLKTYEDAIFSKPVEAMDALIEAYRVNNKFLKSKLHMAKLMIPTLNFSAAKTFLDIIGAGISNPEIQKNFFAHSVNPLLNMCLIYELLILITKKFLSLNTLCRAHMNRIIETCITYIE